MLELRILGSTDLTVGGQPTASDVLSQPRPLALLAYLALAEPEHFVRRDHLARLFWAESGQDHARTNLRKLVLTLRRALGTDVIESRGDDELRLDRTRVWCDATEFVASVRTESLTRAIELYRGRLMQGFTLEGARSFEDWLDLARRRLGRDAVKIALRLADQHVRQDQLTAAGDLVQFIYRVEPDLEDEYQLRKLVDLLDRMGDRVGALKLYERYSQRLWNEFRTAPARETRELIDRVRSQ